MSYCRMADDSDVYVYPDSRGGFTCCVTVATRAEMLAHLEEHRANGDLVPERAIERLRAEMEAEASGLWDEYGRPLHPHTGNTVCPKCGENDEVGSSFDDAWCCHCGWRGSLTELRRRSTREAPT
jgi:hypothetical protein